MVVAPEVSSCIIRRMTCYTEVHCPKCDSKEITGAPAKRKRVYLSEVATLLNVLLSAAPYTPMVLYTPYTV